MAVAPCVSFNKAKTDKGSAGSRYGGLPFVPSGTDWPKSVAGLPLSFIGQIDFRQIASVRGNALTDLPDDGLLGLFYDTAEEPWGFNPADRDGWQLTWVPRSSDAVILDEPRDLPETRYFPAHRLLPFVAQSLPDMDDMRSPFDIRSLNDEQFEAWEQLMSSLGGENAHQVRGHPRWIQNDARLEAQLVTHGIYCGDAEGFSRPEAQTLSAGANDWNLLWQIGTDDEVGFMWGDMGNIYVLIRDEDLIARDFQRAWLIIQCS